MDAEAKATTLQCVEEMAEPDDDPLAQWVGKSSKSNFGTIISNANSESMPLCNSRTELVRKCSVVCIAIAFLASEDPSYSMLRMNELFYSIRSLAH